MRHSALRTTSTAVLIAFAAILLMHVSVMGMAPASGTCHAEAGTAMGCLVIDALETSIVAPLVAFVAIVAGFVVLYRRGRGVDVVAPRRSLLDRTFALAFVVPVQRALWRGHIQRRDGGDGHAQQRTSGCGA